MQLGLKDGGRCLVIVIDDIKPVEKPPTFQILAKGGGNTAENRAMVGGKGF